jgi:hypothetical protein
MSQNSVKLEQTMSFASQNTGAEDCIKRLILVTEKLCALYRVEIECLTSHNVPAFMGLQGQKMSLSRDYESLVQEVKIRADKVKQLDSALRESVLLAQKEMDDLAAQALYLSEKMAESVQRVQLRLIEAARKSIAQEKTHYSIRGSMTMSGRPVATALNEAI